MPIVGLAVYGPLLVGFAACGKLSRKRKQQYTVPIWKPCVIGLLFALTNVLQMLGNRGNDVPGFLVLLVAKLIVPFSALLSALPPLRRRYSSKLAVFSVRPSFRCVADLILVTVATDSPLQLSLR